MRRLRVRYHLSRKFFCQLTGVPYRTVQKWESGKRQPPEYMKSLLDICLEQKMGCLQKLDGTHIEAEGGIQGEFFVSPNGYGVVFQYQGHKHRIFMNETVIPGREHALLVFARWKMEDAVNEMKWQKFVVEHTEHKTEER